MADLVDFVSPMMYPSHYAHGEYGLKNPNRAPYETIHHGVRTRFERLGARPHAMRPYLQDFSWACATRPPTCARRSSPPRSWASAAGSSGTPRTITPGRPSRPVQSQPAPEPPPAAQGGEAMKTLAPWIIALALAVPAAAKPKPAASLAPSVPAVQENPCAR